ncbi:MAG: hypothetical protein IPL58_12355 [Betaproteobacteria bacterium]|uniref:Uncharacterized protein n=1 Tax=Candidatus Proximibacter danicus TaxID=2954365 RepID=A0A9D7PSL2_9PROT|nr:hypothetical protein [Candidatus Proximibacter danicus]
MAESLAAEIKAESGDSAGAASIFREAPQRSRRRARWFAAMPTHCFSQRSDDRLQLFLKTSYSPMLPTPSSMVCWPRPMLCKGAKLQQHRSWPKCAVLQGGTIQAIEQLQFAQRAGDGTFTNSRWWMLVFGNSKSSRPKSGGAEEQRVNTPFFLFFARPNSPCSRPRTLDVKASTAPAHPAYQKHWPRCNLG